MKKKRFVDKTGKPMDTHAQTIAKLFFMWFACVLELVVPLPGLAA